MTEWIKHDGKKQPVDDDVYVQVVLKYDEPDEGCPVIQAKFWDWGEYDDIIYYRIVSK